MSTPETDTFDTARWRAGDRGRALDGNPRAVLSGRTLQENRLLRQAVEIGSASEEQSTPIRLDNFARARARRPLR